MWRSSWAFRMSWKIAQHSSGLTLTNQSFWGGLCRCMSLKCRVRQFLFELRKEAGLCTRDVLYSEANSSYHFTCIHCDAVTMLKHGSPLYTEKRDQWSIMWALTLSCSDHNMSCVRVPESVSRWLDDPSACQIIQQEVNVTSTNRLDLLTCNATVCIIRCIKCPCSAQLGRFLQSHSIPSIFLMW